MLLPQCAVGPLGNSVLLLLHKGQAAPSRESTDTQGLGFWQMARYLEELSLAGRCVGTQQASFSEALFWGI